jgi:medium-chain acyl-[acyl-carrier-protein] hydrolase
MYGATRNRRYADMNLQNESSRAVFSFESRIRFSEVDERARLTLPSMINYLQDCATFHGEEGNVGVYWTMAHRKMWVLASLRLKIEDYPRFAEEIRVSTWATGFHSSIGFRDFAIDRTDGRRLVSGKSEWVFLDQDTSVPTEVTEDQVAGYGIAKEEALSDVYGKRKIRLSGELSEREPFTVLESHLDTNHHLNNGQYMVMAQNLLPADFSVHGLRAEYRSQAFEGDEIVPCVQGGDGVYTVVMKNRQGKLYFIGEFTE